MKFVRAAFALGLLLSAAANDGDGDRARGQSQGHRGLARPGGRGPARRHVVRLRRRRRAGPARQARRRQSDRRRFSMKAPATSTARPSRRALDDYSIDLSFEAGRDAFFGTLQTLVENRDEAVRSPQAGADLAALRRRAGRAHARPLAGHSRRRDAEPGKPGRPRCLYATPSRAILTASRYAAPSRASRPSAATICALSRRQLARGNLRIAVVGAIDAGALGRALDNIFGACRQRRT